MARRNKSILPTLVAVTLAVAALGGLVAYGVWSMQQNGPDTDTDTFTFTRTLSEDLGAELVPATTFAVEDPEVSLASLFSPESRGIYGANARGEDGRGLTVIFIEKANPNDPGNVHKAELPPWDKKADSGLYPIRHREADQFFSNELVPAAAEFVSGRALDLSVGAIVDVTEGVGSSLLAAVQDALAREELQRFVEAGQNVKVHAQLLTEESYPGSRKEVGGQSLDDLWAWLQQAEARGQSSVYGGLWKRLSLLRSNGVDRIHIWTDGLENSPQLSLYGETGKRMLEDPSSRLDTHFDRMFPGDVEGLTIHLHPLPPSMSKASTEHQDAALDYLGRKLEEKGAKLVREVT